MLEGGVGEEIERGQFRSSELSPGEEKIQENLRNAWRNKSDALLACIACIACIFPSNEMYYIICNPSTVAIINRNNLYSDSLNL